MLLLSNMIFASELNNGNQKTEIGVQSSRLPEIKVLKSNNELFKEYTNLVAENYKNIASGRLPEMIFFKYKVTDNNTTLLSLASRCNIPYDTIATLNRIEDSQSNLQGKEILLPSAPGIFIFTGKNLSALEILIRENRLNNIQEHKALFFRIDGEEIVFLVNQRFSPTERAYFLDSGLGLPLEKDSYWISSKFGRRKNPFSGEWKNHKGIDLAAEEGTAVYAVKSGVVEYIFFDDKTFGNYIIISHDKGNITSVYAHLSKIVVKKGNFISKGDIIGLVGSTGLATGPHLHFEIRQGGVAQDPLNKLKLE